MRIKKAGDQWSPPLFKEGYGTNKERVRESYPNKDNMQKLADFALKLAKKDIFISNSIDI